MRFIPVLVMLLVGSGAACKRSEPTPGPATAQSASVAPAADADVAKALAAYDRIYVALTKDSAEGISAAAGELAEAAKSAAPQATGSARGALEAMSTSAGELRGMPSEPFEPLRVTFGTLSQHVVHLLNAVPRFREGRQVRKCTSVPGYQKWVRTNDSGRTPYMGSMMPPCDAPADWSD